jgi:hypothetical protein
VGASAPTPPFPAARLVMQMARNLGQPSALQMGAAAPTPPLFAPLGLYCRRAAIAGNEIIGLSCTRLATAGDEILGSLAGGLPPAHTRFPARTACLTVGSLPRATGARSRQISFVCARMIWQLELSSVTDTQKLKLA